MAEHHCEKPCDVHFVGLKEGEHDWASIDQNNKEHCGLCDECDDDCLGREINAEPATN